MPRRTTTKEKIFFAAVDLFSEKYFQMCTMRELAEMVGIRAASLYKHYESKDEILHAIFKYYRENFFRNRLPIKHVIAAAEQRTIKDVVPMLFYTFDLEGEYQTMMKITRIVISMKMNDDDARETFKYVSINEPIAYLEEVLDKLTVRGKLKPFNHHAYIMQLISFTNFKLMVSMLDGQADRENLSEYQEGIDFFSNLLATYEIKDGGE